ncbi:complement factor H-like [Hoplias malabaricus]|uniref:complement factor H-like n=1 Tax=Hoplias malabaricus TaxID=27720 RepID=UPI003462ECCA
MPRILCLFFFASVYSSIVHEGVDRGPEDMTACPVTIPVVENGEVLPESLKSHYTEGDKLLYTCQQGYVSLGKIIYTCDNTQWVNKRNNKCSRKRCELPADIPNGRYDIVNGTDFVFGSTIKYICHEGYHMMSRVDTRTCLAGGWDNHLPVCEELSCVLPETESNVIVVDLPDYGNVLRYGYRLQFTCNSPGLKLLGPKEVTCQENGEWTSSPPRCEDVTCDIQWISSRVSVYGLPEKNAPMKYGHKLHFSCSHPETILNGPSEVTCSTGGTWSSPFPTCEESRACGSPPSFGFAKLTKPLKDTYKHGESIKYTCQEYYKMEGSAHMSCNQGTWTGSIKCLSFCLLMEDDMDDRKIQPARYKKQSYRIYHGNYIVFKCQDRRQPKRGSVDMEQQCNNGVLHLPVCR